MEGAEEIAVLLDNAATPAILGQNLGQPQASTGTAGEAIAIGVRGNAPAGYGVVGHSVSNYGVYGQSNSQAGVRGESQTSDAVVGVASSKTAAGISGQNTAEGGGLAGRFQGDVDVSGTLTIGLPIQIDTNSARPAGFVHTVATGDVWPDPNIYGTGPGYPLGAILSHPGLDGQPNALVFVTPLATQSPQQIQTGAGNFPGGSAPPATPPPVMVMYGALPVGPPSIDPPAGKPFVPPPVTGQWFLVGASAGQSFHIFVVYA